MIEFLTLNISTFCLVVKFLNYGTLVIVELLAVELFDL